MTSDAVIDPDQHPFITARHVDDLTDAIRGLSRQMADAAHHHQQAIDMQRRQLEVQRDIRDSVDALREVIVHARTNGTAQAQNHGTEGETQ